MTQLSIRRVLLRGFIWGLVSSLLGSLIYGVISSPMIYWELIVFSSALSSKNPPASSLLDLTLQRGVVGILDTIVSCVIVGVITGLIGFVLLAAIPGALGGMVLGIMIHFGATRTPWPKQVGVLMGALVGGIAQVVIDIVLLVLVSFDKNVIWQIQPFWLLLSFLIAVIAGGLVGKRLASAYSS
jgi:hypothetical protein